MGELSLKSGNWRNLESEENREIERKREREKEKLWGHMARSYSEAVGPHIDDDETAGRKPQTAAHHHLDAIDEEDDR